MTVPYRQQGGEADGSSPSQADATGRGFLSLWHLSKRYLEARYRAERYGRPFAVLVAEPAEGSGDAGTCKLRDWLYGRLRASDASSMLDDGACVVLLAETDAKGARSLALRMHDQIAGLRIGLSVYLEDGVTLEDLIANARPTSGPPKPAA